MDEVLTLSQRVAVQAVFQLLLPMPVSANARRVVLHYLGKPLDNDDNRETILLLRSKNAEYARTFWDAGFRPRFVKLLDFEFVNSGDLWEVMKGLGFRSRTHQKMKPNCRYQGLVLTSPRAADAVARIILTDHPEDGDRTYEHNRRVLTSIPIFAVGNASSRPLSKLGALNVQKGHNNAELLALHVCEWVARRSVDFPDNPLKAAPFLFLCGDKRRDCVPRIFREHGVQLDEVMVYKSCPVDSIRIPSERVKWAAFFSPSGVDTVLSRSVYFQPVSTACLSSCSNAGDILDWNSIGKIAIGKTTASALVRAAEINSRMGIRDLWSPLAIAEKPTAAHLVKALVEARRKF